VLQALGKSGDSGSEPQQAARRREKERARLLELVPYLVLVGEGPTIDP
jgi:hypothetical protein